METVLEIDAGNTRLKWRVRCGDEVLDRGALDNNSLPESFEHILPTLPKLDSAKIAVVSGLQKTQWLQAVIEQHCGVEVLVADVQRSALVAAKYPQLGVDRWLAIQAAAAFERGGKVVVSFGTAITVDVVDSQAVHQGGYIVPGIQLMQESLTQNTAQLKIEGGGLGAITLGENTQQCISHGILLLVVALIKQLRAQFEGYRFILTGGAVSLIEPYIDGDYCVRSELVLDGLSLLGES